MKIILFIIIFLFILYVSHYYSNKKEVKKEEFNIYCNEENNEKYDFFSKKTIIDKHLNKINTDKLPKFIYSSESMIPYNYTNNLDNNILYNMNVKKKR